jgi:hypothetical protein
MFTDLFLALKDSENPRDHPLLTALAYSFCPSAARWWLAGAEPKLPFDPVWQALLDMTDGSGRSLKDVLLAYGFETFLPKTQEYIAQIEAYRRMHPGITAPELLPTFKGARSDTGQRFETKRAIDHLGGEWANFWPYVRTWAYLVDDWCDRMRLVGDINFKLERLALTLKGIRRPAYFPVWAWTARLERATRIRLCLPVENVADHDPLRFSLVQSAQPVGEKPWEADPQVYAVTTGSQVAKFDNYLPKAVPLIDLINRLADTAQNHPCPPIHVLHQPSRCAMCGYWAQCYFRRDEITALALSFTETP